MNECGISIGTSGLKSAQGMPASLSRCELSSHSAAGTHGNHCLLKLTDVPRRQCEECFQMSYRIQDYDKGH